MLIRVSVLDKQSPLSLFRRIPSLLNFVATRQNSRNSTVLSSTIGHPPLSCRAGDILSHMSTFNFALVVVDK